MLSSLPADEIEEMLSLNLISDRAWTIAACSAKDGEGKLVTLCNLCRIERRHRLADRYFAMIYYLRFIFQMILEYSKF